MGTLFFYDIPVYRLSEDKYYTERERYIDKNMYGTQPEERKSRREFYKRNSDSKINFEEHLQKYFGGPWTFNEIVGYVRLHFLGSQVRGELWMVDRKRFVKTRKKLMLWHSHKVVNEEDIPLNASNEEVFQTILSYLGRARKELKGRIIDTSHFERIGQYVDWNALRKTA